MTYPTLQGFPLLVTWLTQRQFIPRIVNNHNDTTRVERKMRPPYWWNIQWVLMHLQTWLPGLLNLQPYIGFRRFIAQGKVKFSFNKPSLQWGERPCTFSLWKPNFTSLIGKEVEKVVRLILLIRQQRHGTESLRGLRWSPASMVSSFHDVQTALNRIMSATVAAEWRLNPTSLGAMHSDHRSCCRKREMHLESINSREKLR